MAHAFPKTLLAAGLAGLAWSAAALAQGTGQPPATAPVLPSPEELVDPSLSAECRVPGSRLSRLASLPGLKTALAEAQPVRVLALGSAGSVPGFGGATGAYAARIEAELERRLRGSDVVMEQRGLPGEITAEAFDRITGIITEVEPSLVIWQAGINDALAKADLEDFAGALRRILAWLAEHEIDVVLVEPPYAAAMAGDEHYLELVGAVQAEAKRSGVPLVLRNGAMRYLGAPKNRTDRPPSAFRLGEMGARCIAEHIGWTVEHSLEQTKPPAKPARTPPEPMPAARPPGEAPR